MFNCNLFLFTDKVKVDDDEAEPFYAPPELQLPPDVVPVSTMIL